MWMRAINYFRDTRELDFDEEAEDGGQDSTYRRGQHSRQQA